jgi:Fe-S cluster biogenesis protein NfuA
MNRAEIEEKILMAFDEIRPHLKADGGDIEFVDYTDDNRVLVKLIGACSDCSMSGMTLKAGIEQAVKNALPFVTAVESVDSNF